MYPLMSPLAAPWAVWVGAIGCLTCVFCGPVGLEPTTYGNLSGMWEESEGACFRRGLCSVAC